jgi:signal transduction histidine kinase
MIRTLYVRLIITFIGVVLISLITSFFIASQLYRQQVVNQVDQFIIRQGKEIIALYQQNPTQDIDAYLRGISRLDYNIWLYRGPGDFKYYNATAKVPNIVFSEQDVQRVLKGGIYRGPIQPGHRFTRVVGLPIQMNGHRYALFVQLRESRTLANMDKIVKTALTIVFIVGSILILIAARYLVKPLRIMTLATRKLAQGDFDVHVAVKQKDELGALAASFNQMAKELRELEQMRRDFISNVSHEIQSPLTSIRGYSQILKEEEITAEERNEYLDIIQEESERLSRLSENLLKLASLESKHHPFHPEIFSLDEQLRRVVVFMEPQWSKKHLELDLALERVEIMADQDQLNQVWLNLLGNSIKFTPVGGRIQIFLTNDGQWAVVQMTDTGIGMSPEVQRHIFERFYTGDPARNRRKSGNGLGLSIVKKIVDLHHGQIQVESEVGKGTTFTVRLPCRPT